jgi:branched-chain amino acid transport system permease protein
MRLTTLKPRMRPDRPALNRALRPLGWGAAGVVMLLLLLDTFVPGMALINSYLKHLLFIGLIYSTLAVSLNFVVGYIGQTSLGHAAFYGVGAYTSAMLTLYAKVSFWVALPAAALIAGLAGAILGLPSLRVKGPFLVIVTYGFGEMLRFVAINLNATGGPAGLPGLPAPSVGVPLDQIGATGKEGYIFLALGLLGLLCFLAGRLGRSPIGRAFEATKADEVAASAMGINTSATKLLAFTVGAVFAGMAGSLYAHYLSYVSPEIFSSGESILILAMVIIGGAGSIPGAIAGAFCLTLVPELFKTARDVLHLQVDPWTTLFGLLLILVIRFWPKGLLTAKSSTR